MTELETKLLEEVRNMTSYVRDIAEKQTTLTRLLNDSSEQIKRLQGQLNDLRGLS